MATHIRLTKEEFNEISKDSSFKDNPINILLECDKKRFGDDFIYPKGKLTDPNSGHWDLCLDGINTEEFTEEIDLQGDYNYVDPVNDVKDNSIVAIDFGTSATVVVASQENSVKIPVRIDSRSGEDREEKRYENPTIMKLVNINKFMKMYNQRKGRPFTQWEDISIANQALESFKNVSADNYYAFLYQLKQWAGNSKKTFRFKPTNETVRDLPPYSDLKDGDFDPIELYAYYIGLNINRLKHHAIYLKYYLSFPTTFEEHIRERVKKSFERGLLKSLPIAVQENKEVMSKFSVNPDISEPLAYASCVLKEYKILKTEQKDSINYAIFDFGGGTTDFNFGRWIKDSQKGFSTHAIENLGSDGRDILGGENLLEGLAFEIFKSNLKVMKDNNWCFQSGPEGGKFIGWEDVIDDRSQFAARNMKRLMEVLRPYWEEAYFYHHRIIKDIIENYDGDFLSYELLLSIIQSEIRYYNEKRAKDPNKQTVVQKLEELEKKCWVGTMDELQDNQLEFIDIFGSLIEESTEKKGKNLVLKVELTDENGKTFPGQELQTTEDEIFEYFEKKIKIGIDTFFNAIKGIKEFYQDGQDTVYLFLAGNSCKSPITTTLFRKTIKEQSDSQLNFKLLYPLDSIESRKYMQDNKIRSKYEQGQGPTGKTGVAFGLIDCSKELGTVKIKDNKIYDSQFKYYLGYDDDDDFEPCSFIDVENPSDKVVGKPLIGRWYKLEGVKANKGTMTIHTTTNSNCISNRIEVRGTGHFDVSFYDEHCGLSVYLKATSISKVEIAVAEDNEKDISKNYCGDIIVKEV